tara:strand:+ start:82 stop:507 length:426 start_codon:yes stop_codon:yes gene_type:complete
MKLLLLFLTLTSSVFASDLDLSTYKSSLDFAQVRHVNATQKADGSWCFYTSVEHNDQSWAHYADGWEVLDLAGNQLTYRVLNHPHDNEQPFTRSKCNIEIPAAISKVVVRAKCNKHGFGGKPVAVDLNMSKGEGYLVRRNK